MYSTTVCQFSNLLINITRNQPLNISTRVIIFFVIIITFLWTRGYSFCENHLSKCLYGCKLPIIDTWHLLQIVSFFTDAEQFLIDLHYTAETTFLELSAVHSLTYLTMQIVQLVSKNAHLPSGYLWMEVNVENTFYSKAVVNMYFVLLQKVVSTK